ncbi:MAG: hypothetical protein CVU11_09690 [Bacteroidetes bacterium HGW-Bacteroidetes-6]|jgi:tetratricopeptide (TPR) repeat protein|nr:MAG: hypothetical protein CVU11_09690 [Bacteroidetes bacterium HGW-Bacteroidetes-6]
MRLLKPILFLTLIASTFFGQAQTTEKELLAREYMVNGEFEKARQLYTEIYDKNNSTYIYDNYLECLIQTESWKDAEKLVQKQAKANPSVPRFRVDEGYVLKLEGNAKQSDKIFNEAVQWAIWSDVVVVDLATAFQMRELNDWAIKTLIEGKKSFPASGSLKIQLAKAFQRNGQYAEMIEEYLALLESPMFGIAEIQKQLQDVIMLDKEGSISGIFRDKLLQKLQKDPSNYDYTRLLIWFYEQNDDFSKALLQARAYDKRAKTDGDLVYEVSQLCISNNKWDLATEGLNFVVSLGDEKSYYNDALDLLLEVKYLKLTSDPASLISDYQALASDLKTALKSSQFRRNRYNMIVRLATIEAYYLNQPDSAINRLNNVINSQGYQPVQYAEAKLLSGDVMLLRGDVWEGSLLYSQVEKAFKNDTMGFYAKFRNARFYYFIGEFDYASAQLDILKGATSKLIANDAMELSLVIQENIDYDSSYVPLEKLAKADMMIFSLRYDEALLILDTILKSYPKHPVLDDAVFRKAQIYMTLKQYDNAILALKEILSSYYLDILADNALFMLGNIYETYLPDKELALKYYLQLITDFPGSILANDARQHYRALRGDKIN